MTLLILKGLKIFNTNITENELDFTGLCLMSKGYNMGFKRKVEGDIDLTNSGLQRQLGIETAKNLLVRDKICRT